MSAISLLQFLSQLLFLIVFVVVAVKAVRQPRAATVDTALLFGAVSIIVAESWITTELHVTASHWLSAVIGSLLMALPYLLLRLVDDFAGVPGPLLRFTEIGLAAAVVGFFVLLPKFPAWLSLLYIAYFVGLTVYVAVAFARAARVSGGVTGRRMQAVAAGTLSLGLVLFMAGVQVMLPHRPSWLDVLALLFTLISGLGYFVGFAPPAWLRRAWQEPEVRAFLGRAATLPRLPTTRQIVQELERGAASSLGAPAAVITLWDHTDQVLRAYVASESFEVKPGEMIGGRAFATQRPLFWTDPARHDPAHADLYRQYNANALLAVPITAGEKRLGALVVYGPRASIFAEDDLSLAQLLADQAAVILESRALIDEATRVRAREEATRLKDDFLSAAAHDLKTPLTALVAQAQLLERRILHDPQAPTDLAGIQRIVQESQRLKRLVLDVLDVARLEQGQIVSHKETVDLVTLAHEACARHHSARYRCLVEAEAPAVGEYDTNRVAQLLDNLLENALKYSPDGGDVLVKVWRDDDEYHLTVTDTGIGMLPADVPHIFDRFHRGTNVDDRRFAGMGLGLFICRGIAEQHGGRIWASSPGLGRGSTFHVVLPAAPSGYLTDQTESEGSQQSMEAPLMAAQQTT